MRLPPIKRIRTARDSAIAERNAALAARDSAIAERDVATQGRTAALGAIVRSSEPSTWFRVTLNRVPVWLPRDTLRTMVHCIHVLDGGAVSLLVETAHLNWMMERLGEGGTFVDVGAATGAATLPIAVCLGSAASIVAYEPARQARELLVATIARNDLSGVEVRAAAVSDASGEAKFCQMPFDDSDVVPYMPETSSLATPRILPHARETYAVPVTTLDEEQIPEKQPLVIKVDVEGFEAHVLRGASGVLAERRPELSIDIHTDPVAAGRTTEAECRALLAPMGYRFEKMAHVLLCSPAR